MRETLQRTDDRLRRRGFVCLVILVVGGLVLTAPTRRQEDFGDHIGNYNFRIEIDGVDAGYFKGVDGLSVELEALEYQDGEDLALRKRPGRASFGDVTLKKGYIVTPDLQDWWRGIQAGLYERRSMSIILHDDAGTALRTWELTAWPRKWKVSGMAGKNNDTFTEEITFVVEELSVQ